MAVEYQRRALQIISSVFELSDGEREAYVVRACQGDEGLRRAVDDLLRADRQQPDTFLQQPAMEMAARLLTEQVHGAVLAEGTEIGAYRIVRRLGVGGMGDVYEAFDPRLKRPVALKVLLPVYADDPERIRRFEQEARAASLLNHPNIVSLFDANADAAAGPLFIVTELVRGQTLRDWMRAGLVDEKSIIDVASQIASALGGRAPGRHRAPGHQTGECDAATGWHRQGAGFRARQAARPHLVRSGADAAPFAGGTHCRNRPLSVA